MKPIKDPLGVSPSKGNQGTTRGKEKIILTSVGIEPTTSELDLPSLCRLSFDAGHDLLLQQEFLSSMHVRTLINITELLDATCSNK